MSLAKLPAGQSIPDDLLAIIEIPAQSSAIKYEIDKDSGCLVVDRFLTAPMSYPCNYGYVNQTLAADGDPLDVLVVAPLPVQAGSVIRVRPIGLFHMEDESGPDHKLLALPHPKVFSGYDHITSFEQVPHLLLSQIKHFFTHYKELDSGKWVKAGGWSGLEAARHFILESVHRHQNRQNL